MMNTRRDSLFGFAATGLLLTRASSVQAADPVRHRVFACGWACGGPALYDERFNRTWHLDSKDELSDGWVLPDGGIVFSFSRRKQRTAGVIRLDRNKAKRWEYIAPGQHDNHSCQPLPHGGFLLGECAKDGLWMVEISRTGKELKRIRVADTAKDMHHAFRQVRKTRQNTYLGTLMKSATHKGKTLSGGHSYEWDASGKLIKTFPCGLYVAIRLPNGNTLVSAGHETAEHGLVVEYNPAGDTVWELTAQDIEALGLRIQMVCGLQRLPNGNTLVTNVKHGKAVGLENGESPKAFEITPDKKVVWKMPAATSSFNMGSMQILDHPGNPHKFEIFR